MTIAAACHIHSEWSYDATWRLSDLAAEFERRGYRVMLMAEHDQNFSESRFQEYRAACREVSSPNLLVVPGIEYSDADNVVHVPTWGLDCFLGERLETREMLEQVSARQGVAVLAHPARRNAVGCLDPSWTRHFAGVEIWNRKYDGWAPNAIAAHCSPEPFASLLSTFTRAISFFRFPCNSISLGRSQNKRLWNAFGPGAVMRRCYRSRWRAS